MTKILEATETTGTEFVILGRGPYSIQVKGASATAVVTLQREDPDGGWLAVGGGSWNSAESRLLDPVPGANYRMVAGAAGPEVWIAGTGSNRGVQVAA